MLSEEARHTKPHIIWFHSYEPSRIDKSIQTEHRLRVTRGWEEGRLGSHCLMASFGDDENVLVIWRWLHNFVNVLHDTELCTPIWLKWWISISCILPRLKRTVSQMLWWDNYTYFPLLLLSDEGISWVVVLASQAWFSRFLLLPLGLTCPKGDVHQGRLLCGGDLLLPGLAHDC